MKIQIPLIDTTTNHRRRMTRAQMNNGAEMGTGMDGDGEEQNFNRPFAAGVRVRMKDK